MSRATGAARRRMALVALAMVTAAALIWALTASVVQARAELRRTHRSLAEVRIQTRHVLHQITVTTTQIGRVQSTVANLQTTLDGDDATLAKEGQQLSQDQGTLTSQGVSITALGTCLNGVQGAVNALSVGDQGSAVAALDQVNAACATAEGSLG